MILLAVALVGGAVSAIPAGAQSQTAPDTTTVSLQDAIMQALQTSPDIKVRAAQRNRAAARYQEARASRFATNFTLSTAHSIAPSLDIPDNNTRPTSELYLNPDVENDWQIGSLRPFNRVEAVVQQPLLTWGELSGTIDAARHGAEAEDARVQGQRLEVAMRAGELYQNMLLANALRDLTDEAESLLRQARNEVETLLDEGSTEVSQADLFKLDLSQDEFERRRTEVRERQATARAALQAQVMPNANTAVAVEAETLRPLPMNLLGDSLAMYQADARRHRPEFEQATAGLAAREALVEVARSDYYPKLALQASYGISATPGRYRQENAFIGDSYRGQSTRTGFGIQQNLNFFQTRARVEQAEAQRAEVAYQREAAETLIAVEVEEAYRTARIAQQRMQSLDESVRTTREWLRTEQINFDLDLGDPQDLVDAVQANLETRASYYEAVQRYNVAVLRLLRTAGTLPQEVERGMLIEP
ncbi:transporter [Longimonas halophila]|uniref:Transporter n=1 Tax=Longimonas halophila TaxID=1469170 RepID=A0A2H3NNV9_9BACT|nr:TolC family protein [Longimonas halophila]PEN08520.1 transporter [Longimonas halophila]